MMATFWQGKKMRKLQVTSGGPAKSVVTREECSDLLHLGLKAPVTCFWQRESEGGDLNCWPCSLLPLSPTCIPLLPSLFFSPPSFPPSSSPSFLPSLPFFLSLSSPSLLNSWRKSKMAKGFAENSAAHVKISKLLFPDEKKKSKGCKRSYFVLVHVTGTVFLVSRLDQLWF